jgi:hypothetical protein
MNRGEGGSMGKMGGAVLLAGMAVFVFATFIWLLDREAINRADFMACPDALRTRPNLHPKVQLYCEKLVGRRYRELQKYEAKEIDALIKRVVGK